MRGDGRRGIRATPSPWILGPTKTSRDSSSILTAALVCPRPVPAHLAGAENGSETRAGSGPELARSSIRNAEKTAAENAAVHANTPTVTHVDSLGRAFLVVAHNRFKRSDKPPADPPSEEFYRTRVTFDIEGNQAKSAIVGRRRIA